MYFTIMYPEKLPHVHSYGAGIWAASTEDGYCLVVKVPKEAILTAKINMGFTFYLMPAEVKGRTGVVLFTCFFDDEDEPMVCKSPLLDDEGTRDIIKLLANDEFNVFFFDENNREQLAYKVSGDLKDLRQRLSAADLLAPEDFREMLDKSHASFGLRTKEIDAQSVDMKLTESLFPDDVVIYDTDPARHAFKGPQNFSTSQLIRPEPGAGQEMDIVHVLHRSFSPDQIYLNPKKKVDGEEHTDVLVATEKYVFIIQAKDSPNTEALLRTTAKRKRLKSISQLTEAANQIRGAVKFAKENPILHYVYGEEDVTVDITGKQIIGLMVIKELFDDSFAEYSRINYDLIVDAQVPAVFMDYTGLHMLTLYCPSEEDFTDAVHRVFTFGMENEAFPSLRFSGKPPCVRSSASSRWLAWCAESS
jgi:hypothetical protein